MISADQVQGHWRRLWIKAPSCEDHTTQVHWMQAGMDFADVRIPSDRPDLRAASCLADLPAECLARLASAEGFAGHTTLDGDSLTWHRKINWHGPPSEPDVGKIDFDDQGHLIETGALAEYTELWEQQATAPAKTMRFLSGTYTGVLVTCGEVGVVGLDQPDKPATEPIVSALRAGQMSARAETLFDGLFAYVTVQGDQVTAQLATNPFVEQHPVLTMTGDHVIWHKVGFDGTRSDVALQQR